MGTAACLTKVLDAIKAWMQNHASRASETSVPNGESLEAPLFSMRAMGRMVEHDENVVLPQIMPLLVQIPSHEEASLRRHHGHMPVYTEWTAAHPDFLEPQFNYVVSSFQTDSKEITRAAAQAIKHFGTDCSTLLGGQVLQLQAFVQSNP